jgi:hypothetical protein
MGEISSTFRSQGPHTGEGTHISSSKATRRDGDEYGEHVEIRWKVMKYVDVDMAKCRYARIVLYGGKPDTVGTVLLWIRNALVLMAFFGLAYLAMNTEIFISHINYYLPKFLEGSWLGRQFNSLLNICFSARASPGEPILAKLLSDRTLLEKVYGLVCSCIIAVYFTTLTAGTMFEKRGEVRVNIVVALMSLSFLAMWFILDFLNLSLGTEFFWTKAFLMVVAASWALLHILEVAYGADIEMEMEEGREPRKRTIFRGQILWDIMKFAAISLLLSMAVMPIFVPVFILLIEESEMQRSFRNFFTSEGTPTSAYMAIGILLCWGVSFLHSFFAFLASSIFSDLYRGGAFLTATLTALKKAIFSMFFEMLSTSFLQGVYLLVMFVQIAELSARRAAAMAKKGSSENAAFVFSVLDTGYSILCVISTSIFGLNFYRFHRLGMLPEKYLSSLSHFWYELALISTSPLAHTISWALAFLAMALVLMYVFVDRESDEFQKFSYFLDRYVLKFVPFNLTMGGALIVVLACCASTVSLLQIMDGVPQVDILVRDADSLSSAGALQVEYCQGLRKKGRKVFPAQE